MRKIKAVPTKASLARSLVNIWLFALLVIIVMTINSSGMNGKKNSKWRRTFVFWRRTSAVWRQITRQIVRQLMNEPEWRLIVTVLPAVKAVPGDTIYRFRLDLKAIWLSDSAHGHLLWHFDIPFIIKKQPAVGTPMQAGLHPVE